MEKVHTQGKGTWFGEYALKDRKPRRATIITTQPCIFATVSNEEFMKCMVKFDYRRTTQTIDFLNEMPLFSHWPKSHIKRLLPSLNIVKVIRGQILMNEGSQNSDVYFIRQGDFTGYKKHTIQN